MITNAYVAKLYRFLDDPHFTRVMSELGAAMEEGLQWFELDVSRLEGEPKKALLTALDVMEYVIDYDQDAEIIYVELP